MFVNKCFAIWIMNTGHSNLLKTFLVTTASDKTLSRDPPKFSCWEFQGVSSISQGALDPPRLPIFCIPRFSHFVSLCSCFHLSSLCGCSASLYNHFASLCGYFRSLCGHWSFCVSLWSFLHLFFVSLRLFCVFLWPLVIFHLFVVVLCLFVVVLCCIFSHLARRVT